MVKARLSFNSHRTVHFEECNVVLERVIIVVWMADLADDASLNPQLGLCAHPDIMLPQHRLGRKRVCIFQGAMKLINHKAVNVAINEACSIYMISHETKN